MTDKTKPRLTYFDGRKSVDLWGDDPTGWTILSGNGAEMPDADYYKLIPTLNRAVDLRAKAVATMPFEILSGKKVYDESADWQNKIGFMPNPNTILQLIEAALVLFGRCYLFREKSAAGTKALRYHLPLSVSEHIDPIKGLQYFERMVANTPKRFAPDDYVYFWPPDPSVEIGPAIDYPGKAAANACGVLLNMDVFADAFFERGAIKAMLLTVKGMPVEAERLRLVDWWKRVVGGVKNAFGAQVINADSITPVVVGEGMKELENVTIGQEKREDICIALGVPMTMLFANAANYATSQQDDLNFLTKTIIPECEFIAAVLNEQLFTPLGLHMNFLPETLDAMQEDEHARSQALNQLISAGFPLIMACDILGFELTKEQRAELEAAEAEKKKKAEEMAKQMAEKPSDENDTEDGAQNSPIPQQDGPQATQNEKMIESVSYTTDLEKWRRKALNALKKGQSPAVTFESMLIPANVYQTITANLQAATDESSIKAAFNLSDTNNSYVYNAPVIEWDLLREAVKVLQEA